MGLTNITALDAIATPSIIIFSVLVVLLVPLVLHFLAYRAKPITLPTYLIAGPQNAGKTSLLTYVSYAKLFLFFSTNKRTATVASMSTKFQC